MKYFQITENQIKELCAKIDGCKKERKWRRNTLYIKYSKQRLHHLKSFLVGSIKKSSKKINDIYLVPLHTKEIYHNGEYIMELNDEMSLFYTAYIALVVFTDKIKKVDDIKFNTKYSRQSKYSRSLNGSYGISEGRYYTYPKRREKKNG